DDGLTDALANVHGTTWQAPEIVVRAFLKEQLPVIVGNDRGDGDDQRIGARRIRVIEVLDSTGHQSGWAGVAVAQTASKLWPYVSNRPPSTSRRRCKTGAANALRPQTWVFTSMASSKR